MLKIRKAFSQVLYLFRILYILRYFKSGGKLASRNFFSVMMIDLIEHKNNY